MLLDFFQTLRRYELPVTLKEHLTLLEVLQQQLVFADMDDFYLLARTVMVKDEKYFDKFDRAFNAYFEGLESFDGLLNSLIPDDWLRSELTKQLSDEDKAKVQSLDSLEALIKAFEERLAEQNERHQGGSKWIGTGGTSPFGHSGYHPGGIRVGGQSKNRSASKVWQQRQYRNFDDSMVLSSRNTKVALRKLRQFARTGAAQELDLDDTIRATANNAGYLDLKMVPERHNAVKVLLFFDVGGSMDPHIKTCEALFSACRSEFKHLEYFYFHNFIYDGVWRDNDRRDQQTQSVLELLNTYGNDYKVIFIGDASMGPYEIASRYGSVEYMNEEPGSTWMQRVMNKYSKLIWLNPTPQAQWHFTPSIAMVQELVDEKMYPLTLDGITQGIRYLAK